MPKPHNGQTDNKKMKPIVRIGKIKDQDRWRRDDLRSMSPIQRVEILEKMQDQYFGKTHRSIKPVFKIRSIGANNL